MCENLDVHTFFGRKLCSLLILPSPARAIFFSESVGALEEYSSPEPNLRLDAFMSYKIELLLLF